MRPAGRVASLLNGSAHRHERAVALVREATAKFDADHVAYLIARDIRIWSLLPDRFNGQATTWLLGCADLITLSEAARLAAALEARPDCAPLLETAAGRRWFGSLIPSEEIKSWLRQLLPF